MARLDLPQGAKVSPAAPKPSLSLLERDSEARIPHIGNVAASCLRQERIQDSETPKALHEMVLQYRSKMDDACLVRSGLDWANLLISAGGHGVLAPMSIIGHPCSRAELCAR